MSDKSLRSTLSDQYRRTANAFDFPESPCANDSKGCHSWYMATDEFAHVKPGSFGFNGHQAVFHGYKPGEHYTLRSGRTDKCILKLSTLPRGTQMCTILYETPQPLKIMPEPEVVHTTDRQVETDYDELYSERPYITEVKPDEDQSRGRNGKKPGKGNKKGKKK